jgi:hypothetical protein
MAVIVKILGLVDGSKTSFDNQYLVEYDPTKQGFSPEGYPMQCLLVTTPNENEATPFEDFPTAVAACRQADGVRPDGLPNRPITAFSLEFETVSSR